MLCGIRPSNFILNPSMIRLSSYALMRMPWQMTWSGSLHYLFGSYAALSISGSTWPTKDKSLPRFTYLLSTHHRWRTGRTTEYSLRKILTPIWLQARSWKCLSKSKRQINRKTWPPSEAPLRDSLSYPLNWQGASSPSWRKTNNRVQQEVNPLMGQPPPYSPWWSSQKIEVRKLVIWIIIPPTPS